MKIYKVLLAAALILSGCSSAQEQEEDQIRIGISFYDSYDPFITELSNHIQEDLSNEANIVVRLKDAEKSQQTQNRQVQDMIDDGYDVICVNLVDRTAPNKIINMAEDSDTPIIFFNRELVSQDLESWTRLYYVGADAQESGRMQGEMAADYIKEHPEVDANNDGKIQYVVLEGEAGHQDSIVRTDVSIQTLSDSGLDIDKLDFAIANWNRSQAYTKTKQLLSKYDNIELIISNNDEMALGAVQALQESNVNEEKWPVIIGIDGTSDGLEAVKNGYLIGTIYNDGIGQADAIASLALALAKGESLDDLHLKSGKYIRLPYAKVTSDNVDDYIALLQ